MRLLIRLVALVVAIVALAAGYAFWVYTSDTDLGDKKVSVIVEPGDAFSGVADQLADSGVVDSKTGLKIAARLRSVDRQLVPGRYDFTGANSIKSILDRLAGGDILRIRVTIPEGAPIWKVASIVQSQLQIDSAAFVALNRDSAFLAKVDLPYLEGYLFPETYFVPWGAGLKEVAATFVGQFKAETDDIWPDDIPLGLSREEIVILASIIEAETRIDDERRIVASVYSNRLRENWRLDADPTVIYGLGGLERPLYRKDLRKETPYNTYMKRGLPPTPINSPGLASIEAALDPADTEYYFFVADNSGGHYFSKTNAEHNRAIRRIRQEAKEQSGS